MTNKEKIRAEIEKRYRENKADGYSDVCEELWDVLSFIDSMQEEPVSEDLEEAANQIVNKAIPSLAVKYKDGTYVSSIRDYFDRKEFIDLVKAGAKWQEAQFEKNRLKTL